MIYCFCQNLIMKNTHTTESEKNAMISARILESVASGETLKSAFDAVIGDGAFDALAGDVYDSLRAKGGH